MEVFSLDKISERLLEHGMPPGMPVAIVQNGTLPTQRVLVTTLGELTSCAIDHHEPGLVIVGETVRLSSQHQKVHS